MTEYSFCESIHATPHSRWHIRKLTPEGRKLGGGIDTPTLCGRDMTGWDLDVLINRSRLETITCIACYEAYHKETT